MNAARFVSRLTRKSRSNFFYAFLLLPRAQREAIFAVYAFCRIVDDAVDEGVDRAAQRRELARWREEIARVWGAGAPEHPAAQRLQEAVRRFPIPREALEEVIAGVEMDLDRAAYETFTDLYPYCYRVASAVGLCSIAIFGYTDPRAQDYAINLGVALQLTNILRDVQVDARIGRVYLPQEDLRRFGVTAEDLRAGRYTRRLRRADGASRRAAPATTTRAPGAGFPRWTATASSRPRSWAAPTSRSSRPSRRATSTCSASA